MDEQTFQKIIAEEKEYGVDFEKIEQKYHFISANRYEAEMEFEDGHDKEDRTVPNDSHNSNDKFESIYLPSGFMTPSQSHSISPQAELCLRIAGSEMIMQAGYSLKLPWYTIATGQALFHRFYYRVSFLDYDIRESIMACLFIATKIQESPRKLRDITVAFYHVFKVREGRQPPIPVLNSASDYYSYIKQMVIDSERYVLKELGFELYRLTEHPHNFLLDYLRRLRASKEVAKKAWNYVNDSYRGTICIHYPPHIIAASCLYLAIWSTNTPMPRNVWWAIFDTSIKHILEVCSDILYLYEQPKASMNDIKAILDKGYEANHLVKEFGFDHEETFENLKKASSKEEEIKKKEDSRNPSRSKTSNKHSVSRDPRDNHGYKRRDSRDHSTNRRDRSPRRDRRSRTRSRDRKKKKYTRSPSGSEERGSRRGRKHRSDSEDSPRSKRKNSPSESKKKKKRDRSREKSKERRKEKEKERERDKKDKDKDDKHKHKKDKDKHRDKDGKEKQSEKETKRAEQTEDMKMNEELSRSERKNTLDNTFAEIAGKKSEQGGTSTTKAGGKDVVGKESDKKEEKKLSSDLEALKRELLGTARQSEEPKIKEDDKETKAQAATENVYSSDEDSDKLLELKKKIMENKKKGPGKK